MHYKIHIDDRNYENWNLYDVSTSEKIENVNMFANIKHTTSSFKKDIKFF